MTSKIPKLSYKHDQGRAVLYLEKSGRALSQLESKEDLLAHEPSDKGEALLEALERLKAHRESYLETENNSYPSGQDRLVVCFESDSLRESFRDKLDLLAPATGFTSLEVLVATEPNSRAKKRQEWLDNYRKKVLEDPAISRKFIAVSDASVLSSGKATVAVSLLDPKDKRIKIHLDSLSVKDSNVAEFYGLLLASYISLDALDKSDFRAWSSLTDRVEIYSDSKRAISRLRKLATRDFNSLASLVNHLNLKSKKISPNRLSSFIRDLLIENRIGYVPSHKDLPESVEEELNIYSDQAARIFNATKSSLDTELSVKALIRTRRAEFKSTVVEEEKTRNQGSVESYYTKAGNLETGKKQEKV